MIQSVLPLIDQKDREGNTIPGRLHIPAVVNMLGEDSFHHPPTSPWETLLSSTRPKSNLKSGLQYIWLHLTQNFQDVATALETSNENLLLSQSVERAGFYADGTHAPLVTNALTLEMETRRSRHLGERITAILNRGEYERWAWEAWTKMSATFLLSPPDQLGYMEDEVFQVGIATYLGQPCPLKAMVTGRYFKKRSEQLNWYGANLAAASLPGQGHRSLHNKLQSITQAMMKLGGIHSTAEVVNFLVDKIGHPYITSMLTMSAATLMHKRHHMRLFQTSMHSTSQQEGSELMTVGPRLLLKHSSKSKHSQHAKANTITTTPILGQWIDAHMKSFYLMIKNSRSWIVFLLLMLLVTEQLRL
jgi:hypothetical protein